MELKSAIPSLLLSAVLLVSLPTARAAFQALATLVVDIRPAAYVEAASSIVWNDAGNTPSLMIPLDIKVRLNRGAYAELSISRMDQTPTMDPDSQADLPPRLEVEGVSGVSEVSANPVVLRRLAQSGVYRQSVVLKLAGPPRPGSYLIPLRVRLSLSDGSAEFSAPLSIQLEGP